MTLIQNELSNYTTVAQSCVGSSPSTSSQLIADTGSTGHYLALADTSKILRVRIAKHPITVTLPDQSTITSTHTADLNIPNLPPEAVQAHLFPSIDKHSLLSIGQLCDAGCVAIFRKKTVRITLDDNEILCGKRHPISKLWVVKIPTSEPNHPVALATINHSSKTSELVAFAHAALFSPSSSTLQKALSRNFITDFPGLTKETLQKYPPNSSATTKGHLDQVRKNVNPTKKQAIDLPLLNSPDSDMESDADAFPESDEGNHRTHYCYAALMPSTPSGQIFTDQTGRFIIPASTGNTQLFLLYDYDSNSIHAEPMQNKSAASILKAFKTVHDRLVQAGLRPQLQRLDNECSDVLKQFMRTENISFQLVPPGMHRTNSAERAIRTFKNHFIAGLCSVDPNFPLHLWDRLLEQAVLTLNLLRGSRINPKLSAWAQVHGNFCYNSTPLAPPGTRVLVHVKPDKRGSWAPHAQDAWYIGPALLHYRCYRVFMWATQRERTPDTVSWFPSNVKMPTPNSVDTIVAAAHAIIHALQNPSPGSALAPLQDTELLSLQTISELLLNKNSTTDTAPFAPDPNSLHNNTPPRSDINFPAIPHSPASQPLLRVDFAEPTEINKIFNPSSDAPNDVSPKTASQKSFLRSQQPTYRNLPNPDIPSKNTTTSNIRRVSFDPELPLLTKCTLKAHTKHMSSNKTTYAQITSRPKQPRQRRKIKPTTATITSTAPLTALSAIHVDTGNLVEYQKLLQSSDGKLWERSCLEEIARLSQGLPDAGIPTSEGTNTMFFIRPDQIPSGRKPTYLRIVVADRPQKSNPRRVRFTVGGDKITYPGEVTTKTSSLSTAKILINSVISTPGAKFMSIDIKDFYLCTPMTHYEYMQINLKDIPEQVQKHYNLQKLAQNGKVYVEIRKGMYGLPQAGRLANDELIPRLSKHGYHQSKLTPGLFTHETRPIAFCLVVDDFGVKYVGKEHAEHLRNILMEHYTITTDWEGELYLGLTLKWNYHEHTVDLSMPGYVNRALQRFNHPTPKKPQHSPHAWTKPKYGARTQYTAAPDTTPPLIPSEVKTLQEIIGVLLYYARAIDSSILVALGTLAANQTRATNATLQAARHLLDYLCSYPDATIRYQKSDMILFLHSDASYLSEAEARSRAGGLFFLSSHYCPTDPTPLNGAIHITSNIMRNVLASATEAEVGALFTNAQDACMLRITLTDLGHAQPPTRIQTDNACAMGIMNDTVKQKRSRAIDMRYYWLRDRVAQNQFVIHWKSGKENLADYFTKHHPAAHHTVMRPIYMYNHVPYP